MLSEATSNALTSVADERLRQIRDGWTPEHDDAEGGVEHLGLLLEQHTRQAVESIEGLRPTQEQRHRLVIVAALAVASIEAIDRSLTP